MSEKRVQLNQIVKSQLPSYVQEDFPLVGEFLSQYYTGQEYKGGPVDLIQNIDSYIKLSECGNLIKSTNTTKYAGFSTSTIFVSNTEGFPENYGLIKINDEIMSIDGIGAGGTIFNIRRSLLGTELSSHNSGIQEKARNYRIQKFFDLSTIF